MDWTAMQRGYENLDNERPKDQCEILKRKKKSLSELYCDQEMPLSKGVPEKFMEFGL